MNDGYGISDAYGIGKTSDGIGLGKPFAKEGWDDHTVIDLSVLINK